MSNCLKDKHGLKPAQAHCSFGNAFASCLFFILCTGLSHIFTLLPFIWLSQQDCHTLLMNAGRNIYTTNWPPQLQQKSVNPRNLQRGLPKTKVNFSSHLCWDKLFATAVVSHTQHYSLSFVGMLPLPIFKELSLILEVYWSITASGIQWVAEHLCGTMLQLTPLQIFLGILQRSWGQMSEERTHMGIDLVSSSKV